MGNEPDGKTKETPPENPEEATAKAEAEYDKAFDEAEKAEGTSPTPEGKKGAEPEIPPAKPADEDRDEHHGDLPSLQKAFDDTKTAFTRVSQENAELRRQVDAARRGDGDAEALEAAKKAAAQANDEFDALKAKLVEDYPELEGFMDATAKEIRSLRGEVTELKKGKERDTEAEVRKQALDAFNTAVKPEILKEHQDFDAIMADPGYWKWAEDPDQRPSIRFAAMDSPDPEDIKMAVREYKRFKATPEAEQLREKEEKTKNERIRNAQSMRPGSAPLRPKGSGKNDPKDYDSGWDDAGRELEREGVRIR
jgi:hypothetical protein